MTLNDFLHHHTHVGELCVVRDAGWVCFCAYIDHEDLFAVPERLSERNVSGDMWGTIDVTDADGHKVSAPCHYIDLW